MPVWYDRAKPAIIMLTPFGKEPRVKFSSKEKVSLIPLMFQIGI